MGTFEEQIAFDLRQIEFYKKVLINAEYEIKLWRVFKMIDELFLWFDKIDNNYARYNLYDKQYNRLKDIQIQLKKQYNQQN